MQQFIEAYLEKLQAEHDLQGVMQVGAQGGYVYLFCIGEQTVAPETRIFQGKKIRQSVASYQWYQQQIETDDLAIRRFSQAEILYDPEELAAQLVTLAQAKRAVYQADVRDIELMLASIQWRNDVIAELFFSRQTSEALMLSGLLITDVAEVFRRFHNQLPLQPEYLLQEIKAFDEAMVLMIEGFWRQPSAARLARIVRYGTDSVAKYS
ncbi:hypothetical protein [Salinibius halmophilus]|uniref:hypothetical protein n=1 Tax=Salinibius halmophilus TaxID=1853216 RepID=UPI000E66AF5A|nr:hypothetical protein [Salinibius halmophilus]